MSLTLLTFISIYFGGLILCFVRHPIYGVYAYMTSFYLHPQSFYWGESLPDLRWSLIAATITIIGIKIRSQKNIDNPWYTSTIGKLLSLYTIWMIIQYPWVLSLEIHTNGVILNIKYILLFYILYNILDSIENIKKLIIAHSLGCFYLSWLAYGTYSGGRLEGVGGPGISDANTFALVMVSGILFASMLIFDKHKPTKLMSIAILPFMLNAVIQAGSRGAFLALIAGGIVQFFTIPNQYKKIFILLGCLGITLFFILANDGFLDRLKTMQAVAEDEVEMEASAASRAIIAKAQWEIFKDHPFGGGHRTTAILSPLYMDSSLLAYIPGQETRRARSSHNTIMSVLADHGIFGILIFFAIVIWCYKAIKRIKNSSNQTVKIETRIYTSSITGALTAIFVGGLFGNFLKLEVTIWCLATLTAMFYINNIDLKNIKQ